MNFFNWDVAPILLRWPWLIIRSRTLWHLNTSILNPRGRLLMVAHRIFLALSDGIHPWVCFWSSCRSWLLLLLHPQIILLSTCIWNMRSAQLVVNGNWGSDLVLSRHVHEAVIHCILVRLLDICNPTNITKLVLGDVLIWSRTFTHWNVSHRIILGRLSHLHRLLVRLIEATAVGSKHLLRILIVLSPTPVRICIILILGLSSIISCQIWIARSDIRTSRSLVHTLLLFPCLGIILEFAIGVVVTWVISLNVLVAPRRGWLFASELVIHRHFWKKYRKLNI